MDEKLSVNLNKTKEDIDNIQENYETSTDQILRYCTISLCGINTIVLCVLIKCLSVHITACNNRQAVPHYRTQKTRTRLDRVPAGASTSHNELEKDLKALSRQ